MKKIILSGKILLLASLVLSGCSLATTQQVAQPTADTKAMRTEVAETVVAKITYEAALTVVAEPSTTSTVEVSPTSTQTRANAGTAYFEYPDDI